MAIHASELVRRLLPSFPPQNGSIDNRSVITRVERMAIQIGWCGM